MGAPGTNQGSTRLESDRAKSVSHIGCHGTEWTALCLLLCLVACGSPPAIVLSQCSAGTSAIAFPLDDRSQVDPYGTFSWPASPGASSYLVTVGTQAGSTDVWSATLGHATSTQIPGLQLFTTYYLQVAEQTGSQCAVAQTSFTTGAGLAHLTTPADGAEDVDPAATFAWNGVVDAEMFELQLSTETPGANDQYDSGELPNITSLAHKDLLPNTQNYTRLGSLKSPVLSPNTTYFARLITRKRGTVFFVDSTFSTGFGPAHLIYPKDGMGGIGSRPTFTWNRIPDVVVSSPYKLDLGTARGLSDVWSSGWIQDTQVGLNRIILLPERAYYVRLSTQKRGSVAYVDSAFSTGPADESSPVAARFLYPQDNQSSVDPLQPIVWSSVDNSSYILLIGDGTTPGVNDRNQGWSPETTHTSWAGGLAGGGTYYATLTTFSTSPSPCSVTSPCQTTQQIKFTAGPSPMPHTADGFNATAIAATAAVRNMANGTNVPFPHTFLFNNWDDETGVAVCADFANNLAPQLQNVGIVARRRDSIFGLGPLQHSVVGYHNPARGAWQAADATFGMVFLDPTGALAPMDVLQIAAALEQGNSASIPVQFATTASVRPDCPECFGDYWVQHFSVDPMILYLNPTSYELGPAIRHDPDKFLIDYSGPAGVAGTYIFRFQSLSDRVVVQDAGGAQYLLTPTSPVTSGDNFSQQLRPGDGWFYATPPPPGMQVYKLACPRFDTADCQ